MQEVSPNSNQTERVASQSMVSEAQKGLLQFQKSLISTAKDPIPLKELLGRLQVLQEELATLDQDSVDLNSIENVKNELVNKKLLKHANVGVQAYTCCAISDVLRVYAPDAPFTAGELSLIFKTFLTQIAQLSHQENPYFQQQSYLLKRLAEVRSIILITDLPDASQLIESTFETFYSVASTNFPARLEPLAADILAEVIAETDQITHPVLKMILNKFLTSAPDSTALTSSKSNIRNPAFTFSLHICEQNVDRLSRQVVQFFSEILADAVPDGANDKDRTSALESLRKIHTLTVQVWKFVPELLTAVIGLIDDELNADDPRLRTMATETIGQMVAASGLTQKLNFSIAHKLTWQLWLKKTLDVSLQVRCKWLELIPNIVNASCTSEMATELSNGVTKCLLDTDDRVRLTACKCLSSISFEVFTATIGSTNIMNTLLLLIRESHSEVREQSLRILGNYYNLYYILISKNDAIDYGMHAEEESTELSEIIVKEIPNHVLSLIYINDKSINAAVDLCLFEKFIPFETNTLKRVQRIIQLVSVLNEKSQKAFFAITRRQQQVAGVVSKLLDVADNKKSKLEARDEDDKENNPEQQGKQLEKVINWICASFPEGLDTYSCLERLALLHNRRFFNLMTVCISPESDYSSIRNSMKEFLNKLSNPKNIKLDYEKLVVSATDMVTNLKLLLYRASPLIHNVSNVNELITYAKSGNGPYHETATTILQDVSSALPEVLKSSIDSLVQLVNDDDGKDNTEIMRMVYHFLKRYPNMYPNELNNDLLERKAREGSPLEAKYAIKILSKSQTKELSGAAISNYLLPIDSKSEHLATHISSIATLFETDPMAVETSASDITITIIQEILLKNDVESSDDTWIENVKTHTSLNSKILALSLFVNRVRATTDKDEESLNEVGVPVFKLLYALVNNGGDIISTKGDNKPLPQNYLQRLRLAAGFGLLKLAKISKLDHFFDERISCLAYLVQDSNPEVRSRFVKKLQASITHEAISEKFLPFVFYVANEPNTTLKSLTSSWVKSLLKREQGKNSILVERSLVRLIHLISHETKFLEQLENDPLNAYEFAANYVIYYLQCVERMENASLLYYLASRVKQYRDSTISPELYEEEPRQSKVTALYCIAELCQLAIKEVCDYKNYSMQTWPGKLHLPSDIYGPMGSSEEAHKVVSKIYISDNIQIGLRSSIRAKFGGLKRRVDPPISRTKTKKVKRARLKPKVNKNVPLRSSKRSSKKVTYVEVGSDDSDGSSSESDDIDDSDFE